MCISISLVVQSMYIASTLHMGQIRQKFISIVIMQVFETS